jgi:hypothetical protein
LAGDETAQNRVDDVDQRGCAEKGGWFHVRLDEIEPGKISHDCMKIHVVPLDASFFSLIYSTSPKIGNFSWPLGRYNGKAIASSSWISGYSRVEKYTEPVGTTAMWPQPSAI